MSLITIPPGAIIGNITSTRQSFSENGIEASFFPLKMTFTQVKRITKRDNLEGSVIQHFTNRFGNNNDLLELSIECSTKNIDSTVTNTTYDIDRLDNLENFYKIMTLAEETPYFSGNEWNYIDLTIATPVIRKPIFLSGFFKNMPQITESGEQQKHIEFTMDFWILNRSRINFDELRKAATSFRGILSQNINSGQNNG